jgi:hypothetical protein
MALYAVTYRLKALKCEGIPSFIELMTLIAVAQKLRGLNAVGYKRFYLPTEYWLSIMTV